MFKLQRLEQGKLQVLGDLLLSWKFPELNGLKPNGLSAEGKTRKGVPDSFVGASPAACSVAVEYTSQEASLAAKLAADYDSVRTECPSATRIFLCTNRVLDETDRSRLESKGASEGIRVTVVDGIELADLLARERQDLRLDHLGIPIGAHSRASLLAAMRGRMLDAFPARLRDVMKRRALPHSTATARLNLLAADPKTYGILAIGESGCGKSNWSARQAVGRAPTQPVVWSPAKALRLSLPDPVTTLAVHAAFGTSDASRGSELAELLRRERLKGLIILDAIDEVADLSALIVALKEFRSSALGPHCLIILTCRDEALSQVEPFLRTWLPDLLDSKDGTLVTLGLLRDHEIDDFLRSEGATAEEARIAANGLPPELSGNPLFLTQALTLARAGEVLEGERSVQSFAEFALRDMHERLRVGGRGPSIDSLQSMFADVAIHAIASPTDDIPRDRFSKLAGPEGALDGEASILGRATQVGLLEIRDGGAIGFQHALYLEYFAAFALRDEWRDPPLPPLSSESAKHIARRVAPFLQKPGPLVEKLLSIEASAACQCAALSRGLSPDLLKKLVDALVPELSSRFPSDRLRALELLGQIPGCDAREAAVEWWNNLDARGKAEFSLAAAETFLALEVDGAFEIILRHRAFWPEHPWYEPALVRRLRKASKQFRDRMIARSVAALRAPSLDDDRHARLITLLALFDDRSFVRLLRERVDGGLFLSEAELRALIHANTTEAMEVYAGAVDNVHAVPLSEEPGKTDSEKEQARHYRRDQLIVRTADIAMYPHDALIELAIDALSPPHATPVMFFGMGLAALIGDEQLLVPYASAKRRCGRGYLDSGHRVVEHLLKRCTPEMMVRIYERYDDPDIRRAIVHGAHNVPGPLTEEFLLERCQRHECVFSAVQSLGLLRCYRAGEAIREVLQRETDSFTRHICFRALGMIRYEPAEADLCDLLQPPTDDTTEVDEHGVARALARLGGERAVAALAEFFPRARHPEDILQALFRMRVAGAHAVAAQLACEHRVPARALAEALSHFDLDDTNRRRVRRDMDDPRLLEILIAGADEILTGRSMDTIRLIEAIARFPLPPAVGFLERLAWGEGPHADVSMRALASMGNERAIRQCIEVELDSHGSPKRPFVSPWDVERLADWPAASVRQALLARINNGELVERWIYLLQWFAEPGDSELFRRIEADGTIGAADTAHEYLRGAKPSFPRRR